MGLRQVPEPDYAQILILSSIVVACAIALYQGLAGHTCVLVTEIEDPEVDSVMIGSDLRFYIDEGSYTSPCQLELAGNRFSIIFKSGFEPTNERFLHCFSVRICWYSSLFTATPLKLPCVHTLYRAPGLDNRSSSAWNVTHIILVDYLHE